MVILKLSNLRLKMPEVLDCLPIVGFLIILFIPNCCICWPLCFLFQFIVMCLSLLDSLGITFATICISVNIQFIMVFMGNPSLVHKCSKILNQHLLKFFSFFLNIL